MRQAAGLVICIAFFACNTRLLESQVNAKKLAFDAISIKENKSGTNAMSFSGRGNRFTAANITVRQLAQFAYHPADLRFDQTTIIGGPDWIDSVRFDIEAVSGEAASNPANDMAQRIQSMLEERFMLQMRVDRQDAQSYRLVVGKSGTHMHFSADQTPVDTGSDSSAIERVQRARAWLDGPSVPRGAIRLKDNEVTGTAITLERLAVFLSRQLDAPVTNQTHIDGLIDIKMHVQSDLQPKPVSPADLRAGRLTHISTMDTRSLTAALKELGLELESMKGTIDVFTIEKVQYPSAN